MRDVLTLHISRRIFYQIESDLFLQKYL